eukprot:TRINITY_DN52_c1_g3_i1.p1 TRINITY_DN52_c1_g3~~TRINITY_DN52_c1_g3_i1.p1  ORF type:complete len:648 (-),score=217.14 TRINITY_DN52_c1_g3_i1:97-2040(-)
MSAAQQPANVSAAATAAATAATAAATAAVAAAGGTGSTPSAAFVRAHYRGHSLELSRAQLDDSFGKQQQQPPQQHHRHHHHHEGSTSGSAGADNSDQRSKTPPPFERQHSRCSSNDSGGSGSASPAKEIKPEGTPPSPSLLGSTTTAIPERFIGSKSKSFRKKFGLPDNTMLLYDCMCALYVNGFPYQGHLYLSQFVLCFYCKLFGSEQQKEVIPLKDITSATKKQKPILRIGIEITTAEKTFFFASFVKRARAFKNIECMWKAVVGDAAAVAPGFPTPLSSAAATESSDDSDDGSLPEEAEPQQADTPATPEKEDDAELYLTDETLTAGFLGSKLTEILRERYTMTVTSFFRLYFSNESGPFYKIYAEDHDDSDVVVTKWSHQALGMLREKHYVAKVKNAPIMSPPATRVDETQRYSLQKDCLVVENYSVALDIPYAEYFNVETRYEVQADGENSCELNVSMGVKFNKRTLFRPVIESNCCKQTKESVIRWIQLTKEFASSPAGQQQLHAPAAGASAAPGTSPVPSPVAGAAAAAAAAAVEPVRPVATKAKPTSPAPTLSAVVPGVAAQKPTAAAPQPSPLGTALPLIAYTKDKTIEEHSSPIVRVASVAMLALLALLLVLTLHRLGRLEAQLAALSQELQPRPQL